MPREDTSPPRQRRYFNKKKPKGKSGKRFKRGNTNGNVLLHRLSSPTAGTLLERIGGPAGDDGATSTLSTSDTAEALDLQDSPDPAEAERFLQSVISLPSTHASLPHTLGPIKVEDTTSSVLLSPTQTANSLPYSLTLGQSPLMDDRTLSPSTIEQCKKLLVPVILASIQTRHPAHRLDSEQCLRLLSDDHCRDLIQKAKKMRRQLSLVLSQETPIYQERSGSLKRDRAHAVDAWVRNTRTRFDSADAVDISRRDSDITLVDAIAGGRSPPKAPRTMLQASNSNYLGSAQDGATRQSMIPSPAMEDYPLSLVELVHKAVQKFPTLKPPMAEVETTDMSLAQLTAHPLAPPVQAPSPIPTPPPSSADFVAHLPTQPGTWFRQQGRQFADIVDVDLEVSDDMFYLSKERQPSRVRMHLRLCAILVGTMTDTERGGALADIIDDAIARTTFQWPKKGKLVVQVNPESERHKTWLPHTLESDPVDVTSCIRPGKNLFRFIQLSDLSQFTFVLVASPPPPEEAWRSWDWAALPDSHTRSVGDPPNHLSEFARIQQGIRVTVRS